MIRRLDPPNYQEIAPLVHSVTFQSQQVYCLFVCPDSGEKVQASAPRPLEGSSAATRALWGDVRSALVTLTHVVLAGLTGASDPGKADEAEAWSEEQRERAIIEAFLTVRGCFQKDPSGRWTARRKPLSLSGLERQVRQAPLQGKQEAELLARCLLAVSRLDGLTCPAEKEFLARFAPTAERSGQEPPSWEELRQIRPQARPTLYQLALALALVDRDFSAPERDYLQALAHGLELPVKEQEALRLGVAEYLLQQGLKRSAQGAGPLITEVSALTEIGESRLRQAAIAWGWEVDEHD